MIVGPNTSQGTLRSYGAGSWAGSRSYEHSAPNGAGRGLSSTYLFLCASVAEMIL